MMWAFQITLALAISTTWLVLVEGSIRPSDAAENTQFTLIYAIGDKNVTKTVTCGYSPTGNHPHAKETCTKIRKVEGRFSKLDDGQFGQCPSKDTETIVVAAAGTFNGKPIIFQNTYHSKCELKRDTQGIFDFE